MSVRVWHFDGQTAFRHQATLTASLAGLVVDRGALEGQTIAWADLQPLSVDRAFPAFKHRTITGWQIGFEAPIPADVAPFFPGQAKGGKRAGCLTIWPVALVLAAISLAILWLIMKTPGWLAPYVPIEWEEPLAVQLHKTVAPGRCETTQSKAALASFIRKLDPTIDPAKVSIVKIDMVNAFAVPGGSIMILDGLLRAAKSPEEVAGVLGHEMGHVKNRDVMRSMISELGLSVLLGGVEATATRYLASQSFSRSAETDSDDHSIALMKKARISPIPTAEFFKRMAAEEDAVIGKRAKAIVTYLSSHPLSEGREAAYRASAAGQTDYTPALTDSEWQSLVNACKDDPNARAIPVNALF